MIQPHIFYKTVPVSDPVELTRAVPGPYEAMPPAGVPSGSMPDLVRRDQPSQAAAANQQQVGHLTSGRVKILWDLKILIWLVKMSFGVRECTNTRTHSFSLVKLYPVTIFEGWGRRRSEFSLALCAQPDRLRSPQQLWPHTHSQYLFLPK